METQGKTMLRSFDLARKLKQKPPWFSQQCKKIYEIRTVFRQSFFCQFYYLFHIYLKWKLIYMFLMKGKFSH